MDAEKRKQLRNDYKRKPAVGAVYAISCSGNHSRKIYSTVDIGGLQNRFAFSQAIKGCPDPTLRREWEAYGFDSFSLEVLEELRMKEDQTPKAFAEEVKLLQALWEEKDAAGRPEKEV